MKLVPLGDRVVLKQLEAETTTKSGIVLPGHEKKSRLATRSSIPSIQVQKSSLTMTRSM